MCRILRNLFLCAAALGAGPLVHAAPDHVDITWMSITNMHFALGKQRILADGYIPQPVITSAPPAEKETIEVIIRLKPGPKVPYSVI